MDSLAATIDTTLEEEELIADQLKEWLFGASALQAVVKRREALQLAKDEAHDALTTAFDQKDKVVQGIGIAIMRYVEMVVVSYKISRVSCVFKVKPV